MNPVKSSMRFIVFTVFISLLLPIPSIAEDEDDSESGHMTVIRKCLKAWDNHPFGKNPKFKIMSPSVKVFGIGKNMVDESKTEQPKLVLVKPAVNVMGKMTYKLMNPNGWYCLKANTTVLAKTEIQAHCKAHLASTSDGVTIIGSNDDEKGVVVLGKTIVKTECD